MTDGRARAVPTEGRAPRPEPREVAVIDVGSNSVRLVVFKVDGRAITPIINEKVMAGLGRGLSETGVLNPVGWEAAVQALRRFATLVEARAIETVYAVATAAVRTAQDGPAFVEFVAAQAGLSLNVIDGREEARLSALGVLAGAPDAKGIAGDLGGSSLELVPISPLGPGEGETFALGPLALAHAGAFQADAVAAEVTQSLAGTKLFSRFGGEAFYAVGGAWRAMGRIDIALREHPVDVLHQHEMSRADALKVIDFIRKQSKRSLEKFEEAAAKRADALPYAAAVLAKILERGAFDRVILSSYGLREGLLFNAMSKELRALDPLVACAEAFGGPTSRTRAFGAALERWIAPIFANGPQVFERRRDGVLRAAACRLADIGAGLHPDQREAVIFELVLEGQLAGITHPERAFLAAAVQHRYSKVLPASASTAVQRLLTPEQANAAACLGLAMRLGADLSGRNEALMERLSIRREGETLTLSAAAGFQQLLTEQSVRRLEPLAQALGLKPHVKRKA